MSWQCSFTEPELALLDGPLVSALGWCVGEPRLEDPKRQNRFVELGGAVYSLPLPLQMLARHAVVGNYFTGNSVQ